MATSVNYKVPPAFTSEKPYNHWVDELKAWETLTDLDKKKRGLAIDLSLPEEDQNSLRDKVFSDVSIETLNTDDGVKELITYMDTIFKKDKLSEAYEAYTKFDRFRRSKVGSMEDYVTEFEKLYNRTKKFKMDLPQPVLAFKLLESSELEMKDRQLVLTGVDYTKVDDLFKQMTKSLKKFFGQQAAYNQQSSSEIKIESACVTSEDVNYARRQPYRNYGYRGNRGRGGNFRGKSQLYDQQNQYNFRGTNQSYSQQSQHNFRGPSQSYDQQSQYRNSTANNLSKSVNPNGVNGQPLRCLSCDSIGHLVKQCPHSFENMNKQNFEKAVLFTGNKQQETLVLLTESANSAVLDSACTSTVAGRTWMECYLDSLEPSAKERVIHNSSETLFKFGGGTVLKSLDKVTFPCLMAGVECEIQADVVESEIPLLLSKDSMKKAKMKLDLENDSANIFGKDVQLQCTSSGHYCVPINQIKVDVDDTASALIATQHTDNQDKTKGYMQNL